MPYTHDILDTMVRLLPPQSIFCVSAIGPAQLPATAQSLLLGGHVRAGLEDNNYYSRGVLATNEMLIERTVGMVKEMNFEPASPGEAREILGLPSRAAA
jgi:3-keto-5-aminohexanoate cleavage enzyme